MATFKIFDVDNKVRIFAKSVQDAHALAEDVERKFGIKTFIVGITSCSACGADREDDLSYECNGCLTEMANSMLNEQQ